jgi:hypothetical protein
MLILENEYQIKAKFDLTDPEISVAIEAKALTALSIEVAAREAASLFASQVNATALVDSNDPYAAFSLEVFHFNNITCRSRTYTTVNGIILHDSDRGPGLLQDMFSLAVGSLPDFIHFCVTDLDVPLEP